MFCLALVIGKAWLLCLTESVVLEHVLFSSTDHITDRTHLALVDLEEASAILNRRLNCKGLENFPDDDYNKSDENKFKICRAWHCLKLPQQPLFIWDILLDCWLCFPDAAHVKL